MQNDDASHDGDEYQAWMIRNAAAHGLKHSEYHPDMIQDRIRRLRRLLAKAVKNCETH